MSQTPKIHDVIVVGAGFAGIYAVYAARKAGLDVRCFEAADQIGGTWYFNRYPGARCDVESFDYSFSFDDDLQNDWVWTERYATQPEILAYMRHVVERFDLMPLISLSTPIAAAHWDEKQQLWQVRTESGEDVRGRHLMLATGALSVPVKPDIPGIDDFAGELLFTAQWPDTPPPLAGKRVGVIGTGSSGIQSIPVIAEQAAHTTVFQRTPNWSVPAANRPHTDDDQARVREQYPERRRISRASGGGSTHVPHPRPGVECEPDEALAALERGWQAGGVLFGKTFPDQYTNLDSNEIARAFAEEKIRSVVTDPETARKLIPDHPIGAKRICTDSGYYETFNRDDVNLVDLRATPITTITPTGITTTAGEHPLDVLVFATGFDAVTGALAKIDIRGRGGATVQDAWRDGPETYLGMFVPGFPNLYLVNGPGAPGVLANMVLHSELQVDWLIDLITTMAQRKSGTVETLPESAESWTAEVDAQASGTIFVRANSWYLGSNIEGKPRRFMMFVGGLGTYMSICEDVARDDYRGLTLTSA